MSTAAPRELRQYQKDAVARVHDAWARDVNRVSVVLPTGAGKAAPVDSLIPTPSGMRRFGDLRVSDEVFTFDGSPTVVTHIHPQGVREVFRMEFSDDTNAVVDGDHLWPVISPVTQQRRVMTVHDIANHATNHGFTRIPLCTGAAEYTGSLAVGIKPREIGARLIAGGKLDGEVLKHLLTAATEHRLEFLDGLLDGIESDAESLTTSHPTAAYALRRVVWSLGGTAGLITILNADAASGRNLLTDRPSKSPEVVHRIDFHLPTNFRPGTRGEPSRDIVSIRRVGLAECQCITVADDSSLYLMGEGHLVTHNSTVIADLAVQARSRGGRAVLLAHRNELLEQMADAVHAVDPSGPEVGFVVAGRDEPKADIVVASFQTLARSPKRLAALGVRNVVVADECHHISAPTFLGVLESLGAMDDASGVKSCGLTATMYRDDKKALGNVWSEIVFERDLLWGITNGYLIPPRGKTVAVDSLNKLASIKSVAGDYKHNDLDEVMSASVDSTVDAIMRHCPTSASIVFAVSREHARLLAEKLTDNGIPARDVTSGHKSDYREQAYSDFRKGHLDCLVTVQVLTEGADFPRCDTVVLARPTRSRVLFCQMVGRSVRPYTDPSTGVSKTFSTVLDLTGVVRDIKLASLTDLYPDAVTEYFDSDGNDRSEDEEFLDTLLSRPPKKERTGTLELEDISLFESVIDRKVLWLHTLPLDAAGRKLIFLPMKSGRAYPFLYPPLDPLNPAMPVCVGYLDQNGGVSFAQDPNTAAVLYGPIPYAMEFAEKTVGPEEYINKRSGWRRAGNSASDKQIALGAQLGIADFATLDRGQLSDEITRMFASRLFADALRRYAL